MAKADWVLIKLADGSGDGARFRSKLFFLVDDGVCLGNGISLRFAEQNTPEPFPMGRGFPVMTIRKQCGGGASVCPDGGFEVTHLTAVIVFSMWPQQAFSVGVSYKIRILWNRPHVGASGRRRRMGMGIVRLEGEIARRADLHAMKKFKGGYYNGRSRTD